MAQATPDAEQIVREYAEIWSEKDYSRISEVVSDSFVHESPGAPDGEVHGPDGVEAFMRETESAFPDFEVRVIDSLADDETVMVENEFTMTHRGEFMGAPPTERELEFRSMANCRVVDGELKELREYLDMRAILERLGVAEEPTQG